jgi:hypothetical protein
MAPRYSASLSECCEAEPTTRVTRVGRLRARGHISSLIAATPIRICYSRLFQNRWLEVEHAERNERVSAALGFLIMVGIAWTEMLPRRVGNLPPPVAPAATSGGSESRTIASLIAYRWLEDAKSPETQKWVEKKKSTLAVCSTLCGPRATAQRLSELMAIGSISAPQLGGHYYYYTKRRGHSKINRAAGAGGSARNRPRPGGCQQACRRRNPCSGLVGAIG